MTETYLVLLRLPRGPTTSGDCSPWGQPHASLSQPGFFVLKPYGLTNSDLTQNALTPARHVTAALPLGFLSCAYPTAALWKATVCSRRSPTVMGSTSNRPRSTLTHSCALPSGLALSDTAPCRYVRCFGHPWALNISGHIIQDSRGSGLLPRSFATTGPGKFQALTVSPLRDTPYVAS
jgi:hypothetical protein